jgi:nitroreductase
MSEPRRDGPVISAIRARRVTRAFSHQPVSDDVLLSLLDAARWAPSGGSRRLNRFVIVQKPERLRRIRAVAPGLLGRPPVLIVVCVDFARLDELGMDDRWQHSSYVDVGTVTQTILLAAAELGLGACPVMSFHRGAVQVFLKLPPGVCPIMMVALGYPAAVSADPGRAHLRLSRMDEVTYWETYTGRCNDR